MKVCAKCKETKSYDEFHRGARYKDGYNSYCKSCAKWALRKSRDGNREKCRAWQRNWRSENLERARELERNWYTRNPDKAKEKARKQYAKANKGERSLKFKKWVAANAGHRKEYQRQWMSDNREVMRAHGQFRAALKKLAVPVWADKEKMKEFYVRARDLEKITGMSHHVDHIVPLNSRIVCGLHCEANLQVLTAAENISKGNRVWPDMP